MSNYPPGVSAGDPHFNPPDMEHEHVFEPIEDMYPIFEDGSAIFVEQCVWEKALNTEPGYEGDRVVTESIPCEEQRQFRFEPVSVRLREIGYTIPQDSFVDDEGNLVAPVEQAFHDISGKNSKHDDVEILDCDPDPEMGHCKVAIGELGIHYSTAEQSNEVAD